MKSIYEYKFYNFQSSSEFKSRELLLKISQEYNFQSSSEFK